MALATFIAPGSAGSVFSGTQITHKPRILTAGFGDGYAQEASDGLNSDLVELSPTWRNLNVDEKISVDSFFSSKRGFIPFLFTLPGEASPRKFKCPEWSIQVNSSGLHDVSAVWKEVAYPS